jgi:hypothetical protein
LPKELREDLLKHFINPDNKKSEQKEEVKSEVQKEISQ